MKELKVNNCKCFQIKEVFKEIKRGKRLKSEDREVGDIQYFSASESNNGLTDRISNPLFLEKNAIIYSTFGDAFYIEEDFTASDEISILKHEKMNKYNGAFLVTVLRQNKYKYTFGRKAFQNKFLNDSIYLPTDFNGDPDWEFMEDYIKNLLEIILEKEIKKLEKDLKGYYKNEIY